MKRLYTYAISIILLSCVIAFQPQSVLAMCAPGCSMPCAPNDLCANSTTVVVDAAFITGLGGCTDDGRGQVSCDGTVNGANIANVWFDFVAPSNGNVDVTYNYTTNGWCAPLVIYSGSCGGAEFFCAAAGTWSGGCVGTLNVTGLTPGATYWVNLAIPDVCEGDGTGVCIPNDWEFDIATACGAPLGAGAYCSSNATSGVDSRIERVAVNTLDNSSTACVGYTDYTGCSTSLTRGAAYTLTVETGSCSGCYCKWTKAFIDYDQDGAFADPGELILSQATTSSCPETETQGFTVPAGAALGATRMRVVTEEGACGMPASDVNACGTYGWGETEDYTINIVAGVPPGNAYGIYSTSDPVVGTITDCEITATGGIGGDGFEVGKNSPIVDDGYASVAVSSYSVITAENINCLNSDIDFSAPVDPSPVWPGGALGLNATIADPPDVATVNNNQYSATLGRRDINFEGDITSSFPAQTFSSSPALAMPDNTCALNPDVIVVAGFLAAIPTTDIIVTVNMTHGANTEVVLALEAPNGDYVSLIASPMAGPTGANLTSTVFSDAGGSSIDAAVGPCTGTFTPSAWIGSGCGLPSMTGPDFNSFGGGSMNPNGNWTLQAIDLGTGGTGTLDSWSITFPAYSTTVVDQPITYTEFVNIQMDKPAPGTVLGVNNVCPGTFNFSSSEAGTPGYIYSWTVDAVGTDAPAPATATASATDITFINNSGTDNVYNVRLDITSECCGPLVQVVYPFTVNTSPPVPNATGSPFSQCIGGSQVLSLSAPDPVAGYNYDWFSTAVSTTSLGAGTTYSVGSVASGTTSYWVEGITSDGCVSASRTQVDVTGTNYSAQTLTSPSDCTPGDLTISVTNPVAGAVYNWYDNAALTILDQSGTGISWIENVPAPGTGNEWVTVTLPGCTESTVSVLGTATVTGAPATATWTGGAGDWFVAANWDVICVPGCATDAIIPAGATINIPSSGVAIAKSVTIAATGTLALSDPTSTLEVCENWVNDGTFNPGTGMIVFNGTAAQTIGGSVSTSFYNLKIDNSTPVNAVTLLINTSVTDQLTLTNGELVSTTANRLTLGSGAVVSPPRGSATSFVSTIMDRVVAASSGVTYQFPIGSSSDNMWRPVSITTADATSQTWTVQYYQEDPDPTVGSGYDQTDSIDILNDLYDFDVTRSTGGGAIDLKLWYENADVSGLAPTNIEGKVLIGHWNGSLWDCWNKDALSDWAIDTIFNWIQVKGVAGFSRIAVGKGNGSPLVPAPLPIDLLFFDAEYNEKTENVDLSWVTESEINNDYFTVEKSRVAVDFDIVVTVPGAGTSNQTLYYEEVDKNPEYGITYYRLKQTDYDEEFSYSDLVAVNILKGSNFSVRPNPARNYLEITFGEIANNAVFVMTPEYGAVIIIYDTDGRVVYKKMFDGTFYKFNIDISTFDQGMYIVTLSANDELYTAKFVKE